MSLKNGKKSIVDEFCNSDASIENILENNYDSHQYLEVVFWKLSKEFKKKNKNVNLLNDLDAAVIKGHPDSELYFLFLTYSMAFAIQLGQIQKVQIFDSIIRSLPIEKIDIALQAFYLQNLAKLKFEEGKSLECKELLFKFLKLLNNSKPRFLTYYLNCMNMFGGMGQLVEMGNFDENYPKNYTSYHVISYYISVLVNCGMTGDYQLGLKIIKIFNEVYKNDEEYYKIEHHEDTLNLISGNFEEINYKTNSFKLHAKACYAMSTGDFENARISIAQLLDIKWTGFYYPFLLDGLTINLELCLRNSGKVRFILAEKIKDGKFHYLDDLYMGRLHLLEKNDAEANACFQRLMSNVEKYKAMNRLLFELQFAKDMRLNDIMKLVNGWKSEVKKITPNNIMGINDVGVKEVFGLKLLVGKSKLMMQIKNQIKKYANLKDLILISGETGTGKELVAKALHDEGPNAREPFLAVNCGALTDTLLQSELFGYEAGAFTGAQKEKKGIFESVGKGTIFLDEFGEISSKLQVSLLRVLESNEILRLGGTRTRKIECKIIVASNLDFRSAVEAKSFREDLYFRLTKFEIKIPALRHRKDDIPELIEHFLEKNKRSFGKSKVISSDLLDAFTNYNWPGNIRELKNEIDRLYILNPDHEILGIKQFDFFRFQDQKSFRNDLNSPVRVESASGIGSEDNSIAQIIHNGFPVEKRHALLKELFVKYKKLTRKQVVAITKVATTTATKDLQILCDQGFIVRKTPTNSSRTDYFEIV